MHVRILQGYLVYHKDWLYIRFKSLWKLKLNYLLVKEQILISDLKMAAKFNKIMKYEFLN